MIVHADFVHGMQSGPMGLSSHTSSRKRHAVKLVNISPIAFISDVARVSG